MHQQGIQFANGDVDRAAKITQTNRTGGATVAGGVYTRDLRQDDATSTTPALGRGNIVAVSANNLGMPPVVADGDPFAVGQASIVTSGGPVVASVNGAVNKGDYLKTVAASTSFAKATFGVGSVEFAWAIALETKGAGVASINIMLLDAPVTQNAAVS